MFHGIAVTVWREAVRDKHLTLNQNLKVTLQRVRVRVRGMVVRGRATYLGFAALRVRAGLGRDGGSRPRGEGSGRPPGATLRRPPPAPSPRRCRSSAVAPALGGPPHGASSFA